MACVNADGTISATAKALLKTLENPLSVEEVSRQLGQPLFRVRSSLREMIEAGLVVVQGDKYQVSEEGKKRAAAS